MTAKKTREPMQRRIAYAQLAFIHPILNEDKTIQRQYFSILNYYCKKLFRITKYGKAVLNLYRSYFKIDRTTNGKRRLSTKLRVILLFDILHISGYNRSIINTSLLRSFRFDNKLFTILDSLFSKLCFENEMWEELINNRYVQSEAEWIECIRSNVAFSRKKPYKLLVTATMSAGKSTFINALVGNQIASTSNLACTGRLHYIYGKPTDDRLISKWDQQIYLDAQKTILDKKEDNHERISYESVFYSGGLKGKQCMILDTPGVNSAEYQRHGQCTKDAILNGSYNALIFLINYEHIGTDDELEHLLFIKQNVDSSIPIIFCVNKIDSKKKSDASLLDKLTDINAYLTEQGFSNPVIFFVSSRAAFLYRNKEMISDEDELDELSALQKKFNRSTNLNCLYSSIDLSYIETHNEGFEYQCGIGYIEDYIISLILKEERND